MEQIDNVLSDRNEYAQDSLLEKRDVIEREIVTQERQTITLKMKKSKVLMLETRGKWKSTSFHFC